MFHAPSTIAIYAQNLSLVFCSVTQPIPRGIILSREQLLSPGSSTWAIHACIHTRQVLAELTRPTDQSSRVGLASKSCFLSLTPTIPPQRWVGVWWVRKPYEKLWENLSKQQVSPSCLPCHFIWLIGYMLCEEAQLLS